jgi:alpha,alpha-trehalase
VPPGEDPAAINLLVSERRKVTENLGAIEVRVLPEDLIVTEDHGILYLPNDYIVPGGRFNEMYAWDSYWIILGLMQDGFYAVARGIVENFIYEINNYGGKILNANRTYYLTRSQPPMLAQMAMAVLPSLKEKDRTDFLVRVVSALKIEYEGFWKKYRFDEEYGLFHYGNRDQAAFGLCPEVAFGERDEQGLSHYDKITGYLKDLPPSAPLRLRFYDEVTHSLTPEGIAGDRAMRESGFDASMHMGYYGLQTMDYRPACLNSLLYVQHQLLEHMCIELGDIASAKYFQSEAKELAANIQKYLWNETRGLFCNYNRYEEKHADFIYLTCVYPLWAGVATQEQAQKFVDQLNFFETDFGIKGTNQQTGCQWDAPFMWAPLVYFTASGLHRYGFSEDAKRIAGKFIDTVRRVNDGTGANFEKYNADTGDITTGRLIDVGYSENVVGFGWTNGAVIMLQNWLK